MSLEKYWVVNHNPDLTETGCATRRTYIKTTWVGFPAQQSAEEEIVEDFCFNRFGNKTAYVQGVAPTKNWSLYSIEQEEFDKANPISWAGCSTKTVKIWLEIGKNSKVGIVKEMTNEKT